MGFAFKRISVEILPQYTIIHIYVSTYTYLKTTKINFINNRIENTIQNRTTIAKATRVASTHGFTKRLEKNIF